MFSSFPFLFFFLFTFSHINIQNTFNKNINNKNNIKHSPEIQTQLNRRQQLLEKRGYVFTNKNGEDGEGGTNETRIRGHITKHIQMKFQKKRVALLQARLERLKHDAEANAVNRGMYVYIYI